MLAAGKTVDPTSATRMAELLAQWDRIAEEEAARQRGDTVPNAETHDAPPSFEPHIRFHFSPDYRDYFVMSPRPHLIIPIPDGGGCGEPNSEPLFPYLGLTFGILPESK